MVLNLLSLAMAPHKSAIFIGRNHPDTGLSEYKALAKRFNLRLDIHTHTPNASLLLPKYDYAFVSRYLTIIEALSAGIPVIAHYNNQIKFDYLNDSPFAKFIKIFDNPQDYQLNLIFDFKLIKSGRNWVRTQTWSKLASLYEELWKN